jgi:hypothetical protein
MGGALSSQPTDVSYPLARLIGPEAAAIKVGDVQRRLGENVDVYTNIMQFLVKTIPPTKNYDPDYMRFAVLNVMGQTLKRIALAEHSTETKFTDPFVLAERFKTTASDIITANYSKGEDRGLQ